MKAKEQKLTSRGEDIKIFVGGQAEETSTKGAFIKQLRRFRKHTQPAGANISVREALKV